MNDGYVGGQKDHVRLKPDNVITEMEVKWERVKAWLDQERMDGVLFCRQDGFSWMTGGCARHSAPFPTGSGAYLWTDGDGITLLAPLHEAIRMTDEELGFVPVSVFAWPWYRDAESEIARFVGKRKAAADMHVAGLPNRFEDIAALRHELLPVEIQRFQQLGYDMTLALEETARRIVAGDLEHEIAERLKERLVVGGMEPTSVMVASDERIYQFRTPITTDRPVEKAAMIAACARRHGLIVSATRSVHLGPLARNLQERHLAVCSVDAKIIHATRPGMTGDELFGRLCRAYAEAGFPGEWELNDQGGAIGYGNRDWYALPGQEAFVKRNQAFAWNPTIAGTKSEDTVLVSTEGIEILTEGDGNWPSIDIEVEGTTIRRPDILMLPA